MIFLILGKYCLLTKYVSLFTNMYHSELHLLLFRPRIIRLDSFLLLMLLIVLSVILAVRPCLENLLQKTGGLADRYCCKKNEFDNATLLTECAYTAPWSMQVKKNYKSNLLSFGNAIGVRPNEWFVSLCSK